MDKKAGFFPEINAGFITPRKIRLFVEHETSIFRTEETEELLRSLLRKQANNRILITGDLTQLELYAIYIATQLNTVWYELTPERLLHNDAGDTAQWLLRIFSKSDLLPGVFIIPFWCDLVDLIGRPTASYILRQITNPECIILAGDQQYCGDGPLNVNFTHGFTDHIKLKHPTPEYIEEVLCAEFPSLDEYDRAAVINTLPRYYNELWRQIIKHHRLIDINNEV